MRKICFVTCGALPVPAIKGGDVYKRQVPSRSKKRTNMGEILGYATSFSSLGMMIASLANLIKK